jgi:hypothetical protein
MQPLVDATTYRSIIESLRFLVNTRPNLAFAVGYVSHFSEEPREDHLTAVKRILLYVAGTSNWGLWFSRKKGNQVLLTSSAMQILFEMLMHGRAQLGSSASR